MKHLLCAAAAALALSLAACHDNQKPSTAETSSPELTIVAIGDSLTAGYGLSEEDAYPAKLERRLRAEGYNCRVVNVGVSGETTSDTLSRLDWILSMKPDIVIVETGANDGFRGLKPEIPRDNIDKILTRLREAGVIPILAGMKMIINLGSDYVAGFNAIYPDVAKKHGVLFMPFFLDGVAAKPKLNQDDGIHPRAAGYDIVVENILPLVREAIAQRRGK
jgi:acyl-CoA thioesterase-1